MTSASRSTSRAILRRLGEHHDVRQDTPPAERNLRRQQPALAYPSDLDRSSVAHERPAQHRHQSALLLVQSDHQFRTWCAGPEDVSSAETLRLLPQHYETRWASHPSLHRTSTEPTTARRSTRSSEQDREDLLHTLDVSMQSRGRLHRRRARRSRGRTHGNNVVAPLWVVLSGARNTDCITITHTSDIGPSCASAGQP